MRIVVLRSTAGLPGTAPPGDRYSVTMNTSYADRLLAHLTGSAACSACGDTCINCRAHYQLDHSESIAAVYSVPSRLPYMLEDPEEFLPESVEEHDVLLAVGVHEEVLLAFVERFSWSGGIIVPVEGTGWISPYMQGRISRLAGERGIEAAFPKPFCSFAPEGGLLARFRSRFKIGKPRVSCTLHKTRIHRVVVESSAPCGATYFTARNLEGRDVREDLPHLIDAFLSSYPCTASTAIDPEFGDSIIHRAVMIQRALLDDLSRDLSHAEVDSRS